MNRSLSEGFGDLNLTDIDFGYCTALDLGVIFDVIFKFEGLTKLGLSGLKMESLPERKPFTTFEPLNLIPLSEGFGELPSLADLNMGYCHALAKNEGTYAILSKISTLTKLSLRRCDMESLPEGSP